MAIVKYLVLRGLGYVHTVICYLQVWLNVLFTQKLTVVLNTVCMCNGNSDQSNIKDCYIHKTEKSLTKQESNHPRVQPSLIYSSFYIWEESGTLVVQSGFVEH